ncbi:11743_t:CDS:1, partial [Gigaspora margarita]
RIARVLLNRGKRILPSLPPYPTEINNKSRERNTRTTKKTRNSKIVTSDNELNED